MRLRSVWTSVWYAAALAARLTIPAGAQQLDPVARFPLANDPLTIRQHAEFPIPFTVAGECGGFFGEQDGNFEAWIFPVKLLSHFSIEARVDGYDVPIDVNAHAAEIEVSPDHTTITYSHAAFTIRQTMFAPRCAAQDGAGAMALFQFDSVRPMTVTLSFTPEVRQMWPAPNYGVPSPEWVKEGYYLLHTDDPALLGAVGMPTSQPGILAPYQEKPKTYPLQFVLRFDPRRDADRFFPLVMAVARTLEQAKKEALAAKLLDQEQHAAALYAQTAEYYAHLFDRRMTIETPDKKLDAALRWAEVSIDQARVRHGTETGLVAGFFSSGDSARPGFGWFFGRDTLYTLYAIDSYGDFALSRQALEFLIKRQRADGKMPHEYSQTADLVDWRSFPYEYAAADATPLFLMAVDDYVSASGDMEFLRANWPAVQRAWSFESGHDSDGDGIYDNSQGTGWVESWPPGMPHQEIYLAALDQQASGAMARLSARMQQNDLAQSAAQRAQQVAAKLEQEYAGADGMYAFSRGETGALDRTATIYPAIAWWDGHFQLQRPEAMFSRWASHEFSTDWGTRDVGEGEPLYDPISYHQGSVWPLFTGWTSLAEYRAGRTLSGYAHLRQNAGLTWAQDLGAATELLSGQYFVPLGRSSSHQLWSSAMVAMPLVRGLFGLSVDANKHQVTLDAHLPASWERATLRNVALGETRVTIELTREAGALRARIESGGAGGAGTGSAGGATLRSTLPGATVLQGGRELRIPLPAVEVEMAEQLPLPGARTQQVKVLSQTAAARALTLQLEAQGGGEQVLYVRQNDARVKLHARGAEIVPGANGAQELHVHFPAGEGYQRQDVSLSW